MAGDDLPIGAPYETCRFNRRRLSQRGSEDARPFTGLCPGHDARPRPPPSCALACHAAADRRGPRRGPRPGPPGVFICFGIPGEASTTTTTTYWPSVRPRLAPSVERGTAGYLWTRSSRRCMAFRKKLVDRVDGQLDLTRRRLLGQLQLQRMDDSSVLYRYWIPNRVTPCAG